VADAQDREASFGFFPDCSGGLGDVGGAEDFEGADGEVSEGGHGAGLGPGVDGRGVLAEGDVPDVVGGVLDSPLAADERGEDFGVGLVGIKAGRARASGARRAGGGGCRWPPTLRLRPAGPIRRARRCSSRPRPSRRRRPAGSRSGSTTGPAATSGLARTRCKGAGQRSGPERRDPGSRARQGSERIHRQARDTFMINWLIHHNDHEPRACFAMRPNPSQPGHPHEHGT